MFSCHNVLWQLAGWGAQVLHLFFFFSMFTLNSLDAALFLWLEKPKFSILVF